MDQAAILISQYLASLEMLKQTITECPDSLWNAPGDINKFWQVAYHTLFFAHENVWDAEEIITPWTRHREGYEDFAPNEVREPYDKDTILEYLAFCQQEVADKIPRMNLQEPEGHGDGALSKLELQIHSIRHIMLHAGELMERLAGQTEAEIDWVAWKHDNGE